MPFENKTSTMPTDQHPPFPTYLIPSFSFPFRRRSHDRERQPSAASITSYTSVPYLSSSPNSSANSTPSSSPTSTYSIPHPLASAKAFLQAALRNELVPQSRTTQEEERDTRLSCTAPNTLKCITCATDIAFASQIVSKGFTGRHGRAYLVSPPPEPFPPLPLKNGSKRPTDLINTKTGRVVNRELLTGAHVVADVSCTICSTILGWKYVDAKEAAQRYKIGKFILEMKRVVLGVCWEDGMPRDSENGQKENEQEMEKEWEAEEGGEDVVVFDEEDEDECEDLFAGIWDPDVVAKKRSRRVGAKRTGEVRGSWIYT